MNWITRLLPAAFLLGGWLHFAVAQGVEPEPSDLVRGGLQAIQMIDQNKTGELWDGATPATRTRVARDDFMSQVAKARAPLGAPQQRTWVAINRQVVAKNDADLPAGEYVTIKYETRFASQPTAIVHELVTFHLDTARVWRFSGYVVQ